MMINNLTGKNSLRSNCQPDASKPILTNIHTLFNSENPKNNSKNKVPGVVDTIIKLNPTLNDGISCTDTDLLYDMNVDDLIMYDPESDDMDIDDLIMFDPESNDMDTDDLVMYDPESDSETSFVQADVLSTDIDMEGMIVYDVEYDEKELYFLEDRAIFQTSMLICQKLMKFSRCEQCKTHLQSCAEANDMTETETVFFRNCKAILCYLNALIPDICHEKSLKKKINNLMQSIETDPIGCQDHNSEMIQKMKDVCVEQSIENFCCDINSFLSKKTRTLPDNYNHMQKLAFDHRIKKKKIGKYSDLFNQ